MKKKLNSRGFGHLEMMFFVLAIALISGVGYYVYKNNKAHAGGWQFIGTAQVAGRTINVYACRQIAYVSGAGSTVSGVSSIDLVKTFAVIDKNGKPNHFTVTTKDINSKRSTMTNTWSPIYTVSGAVSSVSSPAGKNHHDKGMTFMSSTTALAGVLPTDTLQFMAQHDDKQANKAGVWTLVDASLISCD